MNIKINHDNHDINKKLMKEYYKLCENQLKSKEMIKIIKEIKVFLINLLNILKKNN